ncbi:MAG: hypothetical protein CMJ18_09920, partial [Phycisphaeraceae bacterium]|nr:hypothetical protein [Phycisphaeraceae bacterium]
MRIAGAGGVDEITRTPIGEKGRFLLSTSADPTTDLGHSPALDIEETNIERFSMLGPNPFVYETLDLTATNINHVGALVPIEPGQAFISVFDDASNLVGTASRIIGENDSGNDVRDDLAAQIDALPDFDAARSGARLAVTSTSGSDFSLELVVQQQVETPNLVSLIGGAERFGIVDHINESTLGAEFKLVKAIDYIPGTEDFDNAPPNALAAVMRLDLDTTTLEDVLIKNLIGDDDPEEKRVDIDEDGDKKSEIFPGFDMLLFVNLTPFNLQSPQLGVHLANSVDPDLDVSLGFEGVHHDRIQTLSALNTGRIWATLIPEDADEGPITITASIGGNTNGITRALPNNSARYITASQPALDELTALPLEEDFAGLVAATPSADGNQIYAIARDRQALLVINSNDLSLRQIFERKYDGFTELRGMSEILQSEDGRFVYVMVEDGGVEIFDREPDTGFLTFRQNQQLVGGTLDHLVFGDDSGNLRAFAVDGSAEPDRLFVFERDSEDGTFALLDPSASDTGLNQRPLVRPVRDIALFEDRLLVLEDDALSTFQANTFFNNFLEFTDRIDAANDFADPTSMTVGVDHVHVLSEIHSTLTTIQEVRVDILQTELQIVDSFTNGSDGVTGMEGPTSVADSVDGLYTFVTGAAADTVAVFQREEVDGTAKFVQSVRNNSGGLTGMSNPRTVVSDPGGNRVIVAATGAGVNQGGLVILDNVTVVGNPLIPRPEVDQEEAIFVLDEQMGDAEGILASWSIFPHRDVISDFNSSVTPLIFERTSNGFRVTGVGNELGAGTPTLRTGRFVLDANLNGGGEALTAGRYFGFKLNLDPFFPVALGYDEGGADNVIRLGIDPATIVPGTEFLDTDPAYATLNRTYSIQAVIELLGTTDAVIAKFDDIEQLDVFTGAGEDELTLRSAPGSEVAQVTLDAGDGDDTVVAQDLAFADPTTTVNDTTINLGAGNDTFEIRTDSDGSVVVNGGPDADTFDLIEVGAVTDITMNGDDGNDVFLIAGQKLPTGMVVNVDGGTPTGTPVDPPPGDVLLFNPGGQGITLIPSDFTPDGEVGVSGLGKVDFEDIELAQSDTAPVITFIGVPPSIDEGDALDVSITLETFGNNLVGEVGWDLDGDGEYTDAFGESISESWSRLNSLGIIDDTLGTSDGYIEIAVRATSVRPSPPPEGPDTATATETTTLTIGNTAPIIELVDAPTTATVDQPYTIEFKSVDPGDDMPDNWEILWGDSSTEPPLGAGREKRINHTYAAPGPHTITIRILDEDPAPIPMDVTHDIVVEANASDVSAGVLYDIHEGDPIVLGASFKGTPDAIDWDLDPNDLDDFIDGTGETLSLTWNELQALGIDDSGTFPIRVRTTYNVTSQVLEAEADIVVTNVAPVAVLTNSGDVNEGGSATVTFTGVATADPSAADLAAGLLYSFDFNNNGIFDPEDIVDSTTPTASVPAALLQQDGTVTVKGRIRDKDGGQTFDTATITVADVPPTINLGGTPPSPNEGDTFTLTIAASDPGVLDVISSYTIDWGDGSGLQTVPGTTTSVDHPFADGGDLTILVEALDNLSTYDETLPITVANVAPDLLDLAVAPSSGLSAINEGDVVRLTGTISDPGVNDTFTLDVDWKDGETNTYDFTAGTTIFAVTHQYLDDGDYMISATLADNDADTGDDTETDTANVLNVAPVVSITVDRSAIVEGDTIVLSGNVSDVGVLDAHMVRIEWDDGLSDSVFASTGTFSVARTYLDDDPTDTAFDIKNLTVTVTDDADSSSFDTETATVEVANDEPRINSFDGGNATVPGLVDPGEDVVLNATFLDVGTADVYTFEVDWGDTNVTTDATVVYDPATKTGTVIATHAYASSGAYVVTVQMKDDDRGISQVLTTKALIGDDPSVNVVDFAQPAFQLNEDGTAAGLVIEVVRTGNTTEAASVGVLLTGLSATGADPFTGGPAAHFEDFDATTITLDFAAGQDRATVVVPINDDRVDEADIETLRLELANAVGTVVGCTQPDATVDILDNDGAGILIAESGPGTDVVEQGAVDTYDVSLETIPTTLVHVTVTPDTQLDLGAGTGVGIRLTFLPDVTALSPQTVTVTAVDDGLGEGTHTGTITHAAQTTDANLRAGITFDPGATLVVNIAEPGLVRVIEFLVSGTNWNSALLSAMDPGRGLGLPIPAGAPDQLTVLPWVNIDQVHMVFSTDVTVVQGDLTLMGVNVPSYGFGDFDYDSSTFIASWTLDAVIGADKLLFVLSDAVNAGGVLLDGDVGDPADATLPSGDGTDGGAFPFRINVLPGDGNQNGSVSVTDVVNISSRVEEGTFGQKYDRRFDVNGDGAINRTDLEAVLPLAGTTLPEGEPVLNSDSTVPLPLGEDFDDGLANLFEPRAGNWFVNGVGRYRGAAEVGADAVSLLEMAEPLPVAFRIDTTVRGKTGPAGTLKNGVVVFDYHGPDDFRFAGAFFGANQWRIGQVSAGSWITDASRGQSITTDVDYDLDLVIEDGSVSLSANGVEKVSIDYGDGVTLSDGRIGLGARRFLAGLRGRRGSAPPGGRTLCGLLAFAARASLFLHPNEIVVVDEL